MKFKITVLLLFIVLMVSPLSYASDAELDALLKECGIVFEEVMAMPDGGIPKNLLKDCVGIAIFPSTIKGAFFLGGRYGEGVIIHRDPDTRVWSAPAFFKITGISYGFQFGGQAIDLVFVIPTERGFEGMLKNKINVGSNAALVAGPVGRNAEMGADITLKGGIFTYSRSKGLFGGIGLKGLNISAKDNANNSYYGKDFTAREILIEGKVKATGAAMKFMDTIKKNTE
ncbi:MAG: lipid-binding SYLF domain-containing protein [Candidatus Omnitrophica bacterium]|nr:lipid-binding SYLF domain-containing protein [Candidatus Omnitrophota bacterium]